MLSVCSQKFPGRARLSQDDLGLVRDYLVARVPTGLGPSSVCLSPDGKDLLCSQLFSNNVTVIRTPVD